MFGSHFGSWPQRPSSKPGISWQSVVLSPWTTAAFQALDSPHTSHNKVSKVLKTKPFYPALFPNKKASLSLYKLAYWRTLPGIAEELHSISVCFINRGSFPTIQNVRAKVKRKWNPKLYVYIWDMVGNYITLIFIFFHIFSPLPPSDFLEIKIQLNVSPVLGIWEILSPIHFKELSKLCARPGSARTQWVCYKATDSGSTGIVISPIGILHETSEGSSPHLPVHQCKYLVTEILL